jgi:hypothetical protein
MAVLTAAITALGLSGAPGLPAGDFSGKDTGADASRTYASDFTRLAPTAVPSRTYGAFPKSESTTDGKFSTHSLIPRITIGDVTDVDVELTHYLQPRLTMSSVIRRQLASNHSLIPRVTMARGQVTSSSNNKDSTHSLVPVVTMSYLLNRPQDSEHSLIPVLTMESTVETTFDEILSDHSLIPVVTLSGAVDDITQAKSGTQSLIPVVTMSVQVQRITAQIEWEVLHSIIPVVTLSPSVRQSGDVDRIDITARPFGYIEIHKA